MLQLYREKKPGTMLSADEFLQAKFCFKPSPTPDTQQPPFGSWYCWNEDCMVREVQIRTKPLDEHDEKPCMHCPVCRGRLRFQHWIVLDATLIPACCDGGQGT